MATMADIERPAPNWYGHRFRDADGDSDRAQTLSCLACHVSNDGMKATAAYALATILEIDHVSNDAGRLACADHRRQYVKTYNFCREHLVIRKSDGRYRGDLLEILDFVPGIRTDSN